MCAAAGRRAAGAGCRPRSSAALSGSAKLATCGVTSIRGWRQNGCPGGSGSLGEQSRLAWASWPRSRASSRSCLDQMRAAADIDQPGARRAGRPGGGVQDAARLGGQRQQADQDVGAGQEGVQLLRAGEGWRRPAALRVRLQPRTVKPWPRQHAAPRAAPSSPRPMMPTRVARGGGGRAKLQRARALLARRRWSSRRWYLSTWVSTNSLMLPGERRVDQAAQGHVRQGRVGQQGVDAGAQRLDQPQLGERRSMPGGARQTRAASISAGSPASGQTRTSSSGQAALQRPAPGLRIVVRAVEQNRQRAVPSAPCRGLVARLP